MTSTMLPLGLAALGVAIGPGLGIVVDRTVERLAFEPEHRCTTCHSGLGPSSLVPVKGWFDRCGTCSAHKGRRYPAVDIATAVVFALLGLRFGIGWMLVPYLGLGIVLVTLSAIDAETHLLPNIIVWPSFLAGLFAVLVISGRSGYPEGVSSALFGALVFAGFIGAAHVIYEPGMGRGDVKLSLTLGLFIGWLQPGLVDTTRLVLFTILIALGGGGMIGLIYNAVRSRGRAEIPFGPALAVSTLAVVLLSASIVDTASF